jgi:hypothetical protein
MKKDLLCKGTVRNTDLDSFCKDADYGFYCYGGLPDISICYMPQDTLMAIDKSYPFMGLTTGLCDSMKVETKFVEPTFKFEWAKVIDYDRFCILEPTLCTTKAATSTGYIEVTVDIPAICADTTKTTDDYQWSLVKEVACDADLLAVCADATRGAKFCDRGVFDVP